MKGNDHRSVERFFGGAAACAKLQQMCTSGARGASGASAHPLLLVNPCLTALVHLLRLLICKNKFQKRAMRRRPAAAVFREPYACIWALCNPAPSQALLEKTLMQL